MNETVNRGDVVLSIAGHDKGKYFFVMDIIDDEYYLLADGKFRKIEKPKKKKIKHCRHCSKMRSDLIKEKLINEQYIQDADLRKEMNLLLSKEVI